MRKVLSVDRRISQSTSVIFLIRTPDKSIYLRRSVMSPITVYTKPACVQCTATFRALDKAGISYEKIDVTQNADAREYVMSLGYLAMPVVHLSPTQHMTGSRVLNWATSPGAKWLGSAGTVTG